LARSIDADIPNQVQIAFGKRAKGDKGFRADDALAGSDEIGDEIAELFVPAHAGDRDQIVWAGNAVHFGNTVDRQQILGQRLDVAGFNVHEDQSSNHSDRYRPGGTGTSGATAAMIAFAATAHAIAEASGKNDKVALMAAYLRTLADDDLAAAARFFTGNPFAQREERTLAVGGRTIVAAAHAAWGFNAADLSAGYRATGDLGAALGPFVRPSVDLGLFRETLSPARLKALLDEIADAAGKSAGRKRAILCERILSACTDALEATYVIKIMTGELRIGLREGLVVEAVAAAFERDIGAVRRAASAAGDLGAVALAAKHDTLSGVSLAYHAPLAFMLASPIAYGSAYKELAAGTWLVEDKYDGVRIQAHVTVQRVSLYSRTLNDVAAAFPEITAALRTLPAACILDGEIVAQRDDRVLPFRYLQARLQRKVVAADLQSDVPVRFIVFDLLARGDDVLLDTALAERRGQLAEVLAAAREPVALAPWTALQSGSSPASIHERFESARGAGNEGLIFKRTDAPYAPGRRGKWWLKLKRELSTLDVVVVAVEWGHGKRAQVLSDYTFAVRGSANQLLTIGKAYSGLTDAEIAELTPWFLAHQTGKRGYALAVEPQIVIEVAFDIIQRSELHESGFALRFPRIVRLRPDKLPADIDTLERVEAIYREMLEREGVQEKRSIR
jgi:DNA ligase-1